MSVPTPAEIAVRLTEAQREAILASFPTPLGLRQKMPKSFKVLRDIGVCEKAWKGTDLLTPLGLAVRDALSRPSPPDAMPEVRG